MAVRSGAGGGCRGPAVAHRRPASDFQWGGAPASTAWGREPVDGGQQPLPLAVLLFGTALRAGWAWALALRLFAGLNGHVCYSTALFPGISARRGGLSTAFEAGVILWMQSWHAQDVAARQHVQLRSPKLLYRTGGVQALARWCTSSAAMGGFPGRPAGRPGPQPGPSRARSCWGTCLALRHW
jgi:hypothetical protein